MRLIFLLFIGIFIQNIGFSQSLTREQKHQAVFQNNKQHEPYKSSSGIELVDLQKELEGFYQITVSGEKANQKMLLNETFFIGIKERIKSSDEVIWKYDEDVNVKILPSNSTRLFAKSEKIIYQK